MRMANLGRLTVLALALAGGLAFGAVASASIQAEPPLVLAFEDGAQTFCSDGGPLSISTATVDPKAPGFSTPDAAIDAFLKWRRVPAQGDQAAAELQDLYQQALAPLASLVLPRRSKVSDTVVYFDRPSVSGFLDARVVVVRIGDGYFPSEEYICSSALTDDTKWAAYEKAAQNLKVTP